MAGTSNLKCKISTCVEIPGGSRKEVEKAEDSKSLLVGEDECQS